MTLYDQALHLTSKLSLVEKVKLLEHLSTAVKHDLETEAYKQMPWQDFIDATYGSLAADPLERDQREQPDVREEIE